MKSVVHRSRIFSYASDFSNFGDDYFFARFDRLPIEGILSGTPTRVTGLAIILMLKGRMTVDVNLATYGMIPDSVLLVEYGKSISASAYRRWRLRYMPVFRIA